MKKFFNFTMLCIIISFCLSCIVCGCGSSVSDNSVSNDLLQSQLPKSIKLVERNLSGPVFSDELQNKINFQRKDKDEQVYIRIDKKEVTLYEKPGGKVNGSVINANLYEIGDKKLIGNDIWYYIKQIYYGDNDVPKVGAARNGWVKDENNVKVDLYFSHLYFFNNSFNIPNVINGKWRHIYTKNFETVMHNYYVDLDSIAEKEDKIYFSVMRIETLDGEILPNKYIDGDKETDIFGTIDKYRYDYNKKKIYQIGKIYLDLIGNVIYNNDFEDSYEIVPGETLKGFKLPDYDPTDDGKYLYRDEDGLVYELSTREPVYTKNFNLIYSAFFKILEGR